MTTTDSPVLRVAGRHGILAVRCRITTGSTTIGATMN